MKVFQQGHKLIRVASILGASLLQISQRLNSITASEGGSTHARTHNAWCVYIYPSDLGLPFGLASSQRVEDSRYQECRSDAELHLSELHIK